MGRLGYDPRDLLKLYLYGYLNQIAPRGSSSNFPRFDVNPNTGEPLNDKSPLGIAENTIYLDPQHPSHIVLPIIPNAEKAAQEKAAAQK
jgi:hypothetical protein